MGTKTIDSVHRNETGTQCIGMRPGFVHENETSSHMTDYQKSVNSVFYRGGSSGSHNKFENLASCQN